MQIEFKQPTDHFMLKHGAKLLKLFKAKLKINDGDNQGPGQSKYSLLYSIIFDDLERLTKQLYKLW